MPMSSESFKRRSALYFIYSLVVFDATAVIAHVVSKYSMLLYVLGWIFDSPIFSFIKERVAGSYIQNISGFPVGFLK